MLGPAPEFALTAVASERQVGIPHSLPNVLVLLFQDQNTVAAARAVNQTVRRVYPYSDDLVVASVVNMSGVPRMMRGMAERVLNRAYSEAAKEIPTGYDPADYIVLLPDWSGGVFRKFAVVDVSKQALMVVINDQGQIVLRKQGGDLARAALNELQKLV